MKTTITLPIPNPKLSPNARCHWAELARVKKSARWLAKILARKQAGGQLFASYKLHFFHKVRRGRDEDGAVSICKAYLDGVADNNGQDDKEWKLEGVEFAIDKASPRLEIVFENKPQ